MCPLPLNQFFSEAWLDPTWAGIVAGQGAQFDVMEQDEDEFGFPLEPYSISGDLAWASFNPDVAFTSGGGWYEGDQEGETTGHAYGYSAGWVECEEEWCGDPEHVWLDLYPEMQTFCAKPTSFQQTAGQDMGPSHGFWGVLGFRYTWTSTFGTLSSLSGCQVGEHVYNYSQRPFPSPPFPSNINPADPTVGWQPGTQGYMEDMHETPGSFVQPYSSSTVTAWQTYRYRCLCKNYNDPVILMGPHSITREVSSAGGGAWKFVITKTGASAQLNPLPTVPAPLLDLATFLGLRHESTSRQR
jgi:hypothetical protein